MDIQIQKEVDKFCKTIEEIKVAKMNPPCNDDEIYKIIDKSLKDLLTAFQNSNGKTICNNTIETIKNSI